MEQLESELNRKFLPPTHFCSFSLVSFSSCDCGILSSRLRVDNRIKEGQEKRWQGRQSGVICLAMSVGVQPCASLTHSQFAPVCVLLRTARLKPKSLPTFVRNRIMQRDAVVIWGEAAVFLLGAVRNSRFCFLFVVFCQTQKGSGEEYRKLRVPSGRPQCVRTNLWDPITPDFFDGSLST